MLGVLGRGAADRVVPEVNVDWRRPGQRGRYPNLGQTALGFMFPIRRQVSVRGLLAFTGFVAIGFSLAMQFTRGMFVPTITLANSLYRIVKSDSNANRNYWARFAIGTITYFVFIPSLDIFFEHLVWRVWQPQGRFSTLIYFFIQMGTLFFPVLFHAIAGLLSGLLAANATPLFLALSLMFALMWILYPISKLQNKWVDPLFDSSIVPWKSFDFYVAILSLCAVTLCMLQIISNRLKFTRHHLFVSGGTCTIAILFVIVLIGAR
jgi:hypothetical protein